MFVLRPEEFHPLWAADFNARNLDRLVAFYELNAMLVAEPGKTVSGTDAIRAALAGLLALNGTIEIVTRQTLRTGDIALLASDWRLDATTPAGLPLRLSGQTMDVMRRQADGRWLVAIDNPYAGAA